jgi:hypothetical protein
MPIPSNPALKVSVRERILQAVLGVLHPVAAQQQATLLRQPLTAVAPQHSPALLVFADGDVITERANDRVTRELSLRVTALAHGEGAAEIADQLLVAAHAALFADVNFGGLALGLRELEAEWEHDEASEPVCALPARYAITYRCLAHDLSASG